VSKPFDATTKTLLEARPANQAAFLGVPADEVALINADLSTVTTSADKVLRVRSAQGDRILHLEFQSSTDADLPGRLNCYNGLLDHGPS
jgi:predicted transposase YdaD